MFLLPDRQRHSHLVPARALARRLGAATRAMAWHSLHPRERERFIATNPLSPPHLEYYQTQDGWSCPLLYLPTASHHSGEPVLLAPDLGMGPNAFRLGPNGGLVTHLHRQGFSVYILTHRGSTHALAPQRATKRTVDQIWYQDIPAALNTVRKHSGYSRVHWIGYGFGAQLGLGYAAIHGAHQLASLISLCGRLALPKRDTYLGTMLHVLSLVGGPDCVPKSRLERWASLWVDECESHGNAEFRTAAVWSRTVMNRASEDVPIDLLRQIQQWSEQGEVSADNGLVSIPALISTITCPVLHMGNRALERENASETIHLW